MRFVGLELKNAPQRVVVEEEILPRLVEFAFRVVENRLWDSAWHDVAVPGAFAKCLDEDPLMRAEAFEQMKSMWETLCFCEWAATQNHGVGKLMQEVFWSRMQFVQHLFRRMAHGGFSPTDESVLKHLHRAFFKIGDTKVNEERVMLCQPFAEPTPILSPMHHSQPSMLAHKHSPTHPRFL